VGLPALSVGALLLVRRRLPHWRRSPELVVAVAAMVMTLFALVLAFAAVNLYQGYSDAQTNVTEEANTLGQITRDVRAFPVATRNRIDDALISYIHVVHDTEFPAMRSGDATLEHAGIAATDRLFAAMQSYSPASEAQKAFYASAVDRLNDLSRLRRDRISAADSSLPRSFMALLLITAFLSIAMTFFVGTDNRSLDIALVSGVSIVVGAGLLTILLLEYPFSGSVSVPSSPFVSGTLANLLAGRH
jgi:Protein of unknown function (DUF4239)